MRVFGIDPGSARTGYGCVQSDGTRHRLVVCGAITIPGLESLSRKTQDHPRRALDAHRPAPARRVAIESLFHAVNARSALKLGHARGVAMLAAVEAGVPIVEYTPAEVKQSVVGYGRAEKGQVQSMIQLLLGLGAPPSPFDAADALAIAVCHLHKMNLRGAPSARRDRRVNSRAPASWRAFRPRR